MLLLPTGCGDVQDAASGAASDAVAQATESAKAEAANQVKTRICEFVAESGPLADGAATAGERAAAGQLATAAEDSGVPAEFVAPLKTVATGAKDDTKGAITDLQQSCAA